MKGTKYWYPIWKEVQRLTREDLEPHKIALQLKINELTVLRLQKTRWGRARLEDYGTDIPPTKEELEIWMKVQRYKTRQSRIKPKESCGN